MCSQSGTTSQDPPTVEAVSASRVKVQGKTYAYTPPGTSIILDDPINPLQQVQIATRKIADYHSNQLIGLLIPDDRRLVLLDYMLEGAWVKLVQLLPGPTPPTVRIKC